MKNLLIAVLLVPFMVHAEPNVNADTVGIARSDKAVNAVIPAGATIVLRQQLGSGTPGFTGFEPATHMGEGIYHAPQYMPQYPTAGVIWPRVVDVQCEKQDETFVCDGYEWIPALGRGEYLYIRPVAKAAPKIVEKIVVVPVPGPERIILKEVPVKKKRE